jgi:hypothetical protein
MALGRVPDLRRSSFLLPKGCAACRGRGHLEARTACRSETNMPLVLILGQSPRVHTETVILFLDLTGTQEILLF